MDAVELDDERTWPPAFAALMHDVASEARGWEEASSSVAGELASHDWELAERLDSQARSALVGRRILVYHAMTTLMRFSPDLLTEIRHS